MSQPSRVPSKQLVRSATIGGSIGAAIEVVAAAAGYPLPPGTGEALTALFTAAAHYFQKHGRRSRPLPPPEIP